MIPEQIYTGKALNPAVTVTFGGVKSSAAKKQKAKYKKLFKASTGYKKTMKIK